ncbi:MAG: TIGR01777 family oxidoreductase [Planctomycetaceae bacterium]
MSSQLNSTVAMSGATGLVGSQVTSVLKQQGCSVVAISRGSGSYDETIRWDPKTGLTNPGRLESVDAVIHLAGENIASGRWTDSLKQKIRSSRVQGTRSIVQSMAAIQKRPRVFICASAIGYYGDRGERLLDESASPGDDFLADVCREWEAEADAAEQLGIRVVKVRIGVVLSPRGGALKKMLLPFKLGLGGNVGSGQQYWSWIGLHDLGRIFQFCLNNDSVSGPVNAVSPQSLTNAEFTKAVGSVLHRPTFIPMPAFAAKLVLGEMAEALLLSSTRVEPRKLLAAGFSFDHPDLTDCLNFELNAVGNS